MLKNVKIINDTSATTIEYFTNYIQQDRPLFFGRTGGSDYHVIHKYFYNKNLISDAHFCSWAAEYVKQYNGYFDFDNDINNFHRYLDNMIAYYKRSDDVCFSNPDLHYKMTGRDPFPIDEETFLNYILDGKTALLYGFIETVRPFLKSFSTWGKNKKILVISPFSKSIEHQFLNKDNLYLNYKFPEFELLTYNTKITYNSTTDTGESLGVQTRNWHQECHKMAEEISRLDFDIALLSCGSYAMFLGDFIKHKLGKKSIYIGGVINVYFNIYGSKYKYNYAMWGLNPDTLIDPFENEDIKNIKGGRLKAQECLNGYFGSKLDM